MKLVRAACVAPMDRSGLLRDAAVLVDGEVVIALGDAATLARENPAAEVFDYGDALVLPGLVNAHAHLELSDMQALERPASFASWIGGVIRQRASLGEQAGPAAARAAEIGAAESLRFGVTTVGDISKFAPQTRPALAASPLRVISFGEVQAMAGRRGLLAGRFADATDLRWDGWTDRNRLSVAVSPHAPYSVEPDGYAACLDWAKRHNRPITTHLAETADEAAFLAEHGGPLRGIWDAMRDWTGDVPTFAGGPVRLADSLGLLAYEKALLAHVNYVDDDELGVLARGRASVVWCPRTHAYFGHEPHRWREMLARGVNVCVGTDSRASSPDLNVLDDVRLLRRSRPGVSATALLEMVTTRPAAAMGLADRVGSLRVGAWADLAIFPGVGRDADPLGASLDDEVAPMATWVAGEATAASGV